MTLFIKLKSLKNKLFQGKSSTPYPYKFYNDIFNIYFEINNPIEEFRLAKWGGEKEYTIDLIGNLNESDVFYDIGSSVGLVSVTAASILKKGKVVSFEPDPENILRLKTNYSINNLSNYILKPLAVGDSKSRLQLFTQGSNGYSPSLKPVNGIERTIEVEVNSIDNLIGRNEIPYPDVIKIDIEGAELMALKGMTALLSSDKRPRLIFLELHPTFLPSFGCSVQDVFDFLATFNYSIAENVQRDEQILCKLISN